MQLSQTALVKWLKPLTGGLLAAFVLLLNALAASPQLHEFFHADAGKVDHQCAVTLFAHGQIDSPVADEAAIVPAAALDLLPQISVSIPNALVESLPPGRGPPVSSLRS